MIYVDSSVLTAVLLHESAHEHLQARLMRGGLFSSLLLEAEVQSALQREKLPREAFEQFGELMTWITPTRSLKSEISEVLDCGYLRGADLWHVSCAVYAFRNRRKVEFFSLDKNQRAVAAKCGFKLYPGKL